MRFYKDEWDTYIENCGFTDNEMAVIQYLRRGNDLYFIADALGYDRSTICRRIKKIKLKINRYKSLLR